MYSPRVSVDIACVAHKFQEPKNQEFSWFVLCLVLVPLVFGSFGGTPRRTFPTVWLKTQSGFAGSVGQGGDATMVSVMAAIEGDLLDAGGDGALREELADCLGGVLVAAVGHGVADVFIFGA